MTGLVDKFRFLTPLIKLFPSFIIIIIFKPKSVIGQSGPCFTNMILCSDFQNKYNDVAPLFHNIRGSPSPPSLSALYSLDGQLPCSFAASPNAIILSKVQTLFLVSLLFCSFGLPRKSETSYEKKIRFS